VLTTIDHALREPPPGLASLGHPPPTQPGPARVAQYSAQVGQARLAAGEGF
jgi:hypothetical protein